MSYQNLAAKFAFDDFNESKHPRGQPANAGQFASSSGGGGSGGKAPAAPAGGTSTQAGGGGSTAKVAPIVNTHVKKALLEQGFKKYKAPFGGETDTVMFKHDGSNTVVAIHPSPKGLSSSSKWAASNGAEGDGGKSLNEFLAKHVAKAEGAKPSQVEATAKAIAELKAVQSGGKGETAEKEYKASYKIIAGKGYTPSVSHPGKNVIIFAKSNGDKIELNSATGKWLAKSQGHLTKTGVGATNLKDLLDGKNTGAWSNTNETSLGGVATTAAAPVSTSPYDTPEYKAKLAATQKAEAEKANAVAAVKAKQAEAGAKSLAAYPGLVKQAPVPTTAEQSALKTYGGSGYTEINGNLRAGKDAAVTKTVKELDAYLNKSEIPEDMVVFRGVGGAYAETLKSILAPGAAFMDRGFSSTTAKHDLGFGGGLSGGLQFHIELPKGSKGAAIGDHSGHPGEKEILLPRNTMFKVKSYDRKTGEVVVTVDQSQVGQDAAQAQDEFEESKHPRAENGQFGSGKSTYAGEEGVQRQSPDSVESPKYDPDIVKKTKNIKLDRIDFDRQETQEIELSSLVSAQPDVNPRKVQRISSEFDLKEMPPIYVVQTGGKNVIWEGNHRVNAAEYAGLKKLPAKVIKINEAKAQDSFAMDKSTVRRIDDDGHLFVEQTPISKANVCPYYGKEIPDFQALGLDPEKTYKLYRDPKELAKAASTFAGKPLLLIHTAISSDEHPREVVVGSIGDNVRFNAPYLMAPLSIWDGEAIGLVQSGKQKELSSAYRYRADMTPGKADGESYDGVMRDIGGNHVALVKEGRAGPDVVVGDSKQEIPMKKTTLLSRKAVLAQGALMAYLAPKLAQDQKIALAPMLVGITAKNFGKEAPGLIDRVTKAVKGKLAQDADIADLVELIDGLKAGEDPAEDEMEPNNGTVENKTMKARGYDAVKEILKDKLSAEDMKACDDAMEDDDDEDGQEAMDEDQDDDEDDKKKDKKDKPAEDEEVKEEKVTKKAMDAAIAKSVKVAQDEMRKSQREIEEAKEIVLPYVGKLAMAHDSAADVYRTALTALNVNVDDVHPSAFKAIITNLPKPGAHPAALPQTRVAMDAKSVSLFTEMFPAAGIVKHI